MNSPDNTRYILVPTDQHIYSYTIEVPQNGISYNHTDKSGEQFVLG